MEDNSFELETHPFIIRLEDEKGNYAYILFNKEGLTKEDIQKISIEVISIKEETMELKQDVAGLREMLQSLIISVDKLVKSLSDLREEYLAISFKVDRHEKWFLQIAEKLGLKLEY